MEAPGDEKPRPRKRRTYDVAEKILAATIHRNPDSQLRVYAVRMVARDAQMVPRDSGQPPEYVNISIGRWFKCRDGGWRSDAKPWCGGPLIFPSEIPLVVVGLQRTLEMTRERGWL